MFGEDVWEGWGGGGGCEGVKFDAYMIFRNEGVMT